MRFGVSWDFSTSDARAVWSVVLAEIEQADKLGYDSAWVAESRNTGSACPSPAVFLTWAARKTGSIQLREASRGVTRSNPVRLAEEVAVLDLFSRGRAGIAFASARSTGIPPEQVQKTIEFIQAAWGMDELRFFSDCLRFPAHTSSDAPRGASEPELAGDYVPQWERGPVTPDFLAVTPKPYAPRPPIYVEIEEPETLEWAAREGIAPFVGADVATDEAVDRLARYREVSTQSGHRPGGVELVLERRIAVDGSGDAQTVGGSPQDIVAALREIRAAASISHLIWRRAGSGDGDLLRFSGEVQPLLQA